MAWTQIDLDKTESPPVLLTESDRCYYAREYIAKGRYDASEANQLISNLKKDSDRRGTFQWKYKVAAADQFARELAAAFTPNTDIVIAFIPTSKCATDPAYDPRWDMVEERLPRHNKRIRVEKPLSRSTSTDAVHRGGKRSIEPIKASLQWDGFSQPTDRLFLVDDIITAGTHYRACEQIIRGHQPSIKIAGLFWARVIWPDDGVDD